MLGDGRWCLISSLNAIQNSVLHVVSTFPPTRPPPTYFDTAFLGFAAETPAPSSKLSSLRILGFRI